MEVAILVITIFTLLLVLLLATAYTCNRYVCIGFCDGGDTDSIQDTEESLASENDVISAANNCSSSSGGERQTFESECACADEDCVDEMTPEVKGRARSGGYHECPVEMDEKDSEQSFVNDNVEESLL